MSRAIETVGMLLTIGFVLLGISRLVLKARKNGQPLDVGAWFFLITISLPAGAIFVMTLLGYH